MPLQSWRDCQAWRDEGFSWSTTSNEAVKLYDAALTQVVQYQDEPEMGGLEKTFEKMVEADPNFVMGHILMHGLKLSGGGVANPEIHPDVRNEIDSVLNLAAKQTLTDHENKHVEAFTRLAEGRLEDATRVYEEILVDHPNDYAAIRLAYFTYFFSGQQAGMRDYMASVVPRCDPTNPLHGYLYGLWAFGEVETNRFDSGEKLARRGLELHPCDPWATHTMSHLLDHTCRHDEAIQFLTSTRQNWETGKALLCHNTWHLALFHIEKNDPEAALALYDEKLQYHDAVMFHAVDRGSLLRRLELQGIDVGGRWKDVYEVGRPYIDDHASVFQQYHSLLISLGSKRITEAKNFLNDIQDVVRKLPSHNYYRRTTESVGVPLYKALIAYEEEDFPTTVNILRSIRYRIPPVGGSNAQRDLLNLLLINAAFKSTDPSHADLPRALLYERIAQRKGSPMTEALMAKAILKHEQM